MKRALYIIPLAAALIVGVAWVHTPYWRVSDIVVENTSEMQGAVTISDAITLTGAITQTGDFTQYGDFTTTGTLDVTGAATMADALSISGKATLDGELNIDSDDDTITTSSTEIDVAGKNRIVVTTNGATTGVTLANGEEDQQVTLIGTSDSNTVQVDDGASYAIGGNKTLGEDDVLTLYTLNGSKWIAIDYLDN